MQLLIVDDHPLFRSGVRQLLQYRIPGAELAEAAHGAAALESVRDSEPRVIIMDLHLPDGDGIRFSSEILAAHPSVKIIILSGDSNLQHVDEALKVGVAGYLLKVSASEELPRALEAVLSGRTYLCPEANEAVLDHYRQALAAQGAKDQPQLSPREKEVLCLIAEGARTKEIAARLNVGLKTVETFRRRLLKKLRCASTAELVRYAVRAQMVAP